MFRRDMIVMGASIGGVEALLSIARELPTDFAAAICVVLHTNPEGFGRMSAVLDRAGVLPASTAVDGEPIYSGGRPSDRG